MSDIITVKHLIKRYHKADSNAVDDVSVSVSPGEFFSLLGPNGAGKTTTISILTTTLSKTSGHVTIAGFDIDKQASEVRRSVGIIFQKPSLDENLTAEENVRLHALLYGLYPYYPTYGMMPSDYKKKVQELAEVLEIKKEIFDPIRTFSGGMKRKLEIIRSLIHNPKVLFLDEPTVGLDPASRRNLWEYLGRVRKKEDTTIFLTTHYLDETEDCDNIAIMNKGKIIQYGSPEHIKRNLAQSLLLIDSTNRDKLKEELKHLNVKFKENDLVEIDVKEINVQKLLTHLKSELSVIKTHNPTLEEAYLSIIDNPKEPGDE